MINAFDYSEADLSTKYGTPCVIAGLLTISLLLCTTHTLSREAGPNFFPIGYRLIEKTPLTSFIFVEFRDGPSDSRGQFPQNLVFDVVVVHLGTTGT